MDYYVGIDVSKHKHTVAIIDQEANVISKPHNIANTKEGFDSLLNELGLLGPKEQIKIGLEATGHYMNCLVKYLVKNGYQVQIYNPFLIENYRKTLSNNAAKTDKLDACLIAQYVSTHAFASTPQISYQIEEVRKISRAKYFLFADKIRAYNHLQRYLDEVFPEFCSFFDKKEDGSKASKGRNLFESKTIRWLLLNYPSASKIAKMRSESGDHLRRISKGSFSFGKFNLLRETAKNSIGISTPADEQIIKSLVQEIQTIDDQIDVLNSELEPLMKQINSPLTSIPGMGMHIAAMIIGEIGDIDRFENPEKLIKFAGLDVKIYQSGTIFKRGKISKKGSPIFRYALALCVQKLRIHSPVFSDYYYSKIQEGKPTNVAITATTRKLIRVIWKMMKTNKVFDNLKKR